MSSILNIHNINRATVGMEVIRIRMEKKLSYRKIERDTGISAASVKRIENGDNYESRTYEILVKYLLKGEKPIIKPY